MPFAAACEVIPAGVTSRSGGPGRPLYWRGEGPFWDVDGNRYVDYARPRTAHLGHAPIVAATRSPLIGQDLTFGSQHRLEPELAEFPGTVPGAEQVIFATTGSEAVAAALRLARVVTGRDLVVKFEGHYHGWLDGVFASTAFDPERSGPVDRPATVPATLGIPESALADLVVAQWNDLGSVAAILEANPGGVAATRQSRSR
jgi:glutamate-1-semialdehyde 2,1-aminomutase